MFNFTNNYTSSIVRSNQNGVMYRLQGLGQVTYAIVRAADNSLIKTGTRDACKAFWNRYVKNTRQFVTPNGVNHRYTCK